MSVDGGAKHSAPTGNLQRSSLDDLIAGIGAAAPAPASADAMAIWSPEARAAAEAVDRLIVLLEEEAARWDDRSKTTCKTVKCIEKYIHTIFTLRPFVCEERDAHAFKTGWFYRNASFDELRLCFHHSKPDYVNRRTLAQYLLTSIARPLFGESFDSLLSSAPASVKRAKAAAAKIPRIQ